MLSANLSEDFHSINSSAASALEQQSHYHHKAGMFYQQDVSVL